MYDLTGEVLARHWSRRRLIASGGAAAAAAALSVGAGLALSRSGSSEQEGTGDQEQGPVAAEAALNANQNGERGISDPWKRASHLLRRAGFGGTRAEIELYAALSPEEAADRLLSFDSVDNAALEERLRREGLTRDQLVRAGPRNVMHQQFERWWLNRMAFTARPLEERMTLIWHGLLTSQVTTLGSLAPLLLKQNELYRSLAVARYDDLLLATSKDPAMMYYLDTVRSSAAHPNENFARELLELFSMGEGSYTEEDVREAARAFTGWRVTPLPRPNVPEGATQRERQQALQEAVASWNPEWMLAPRLHDDGMKVFLGRRGNFGGEDIVAIVMEQEATARYITTRLFREFVYDDPAPESIDRLVDVWNRSGHSIREVVRAILAGDEFWSERAYRAKVRSPVELVVAAVRGLELGALPGGAVQAGRRRTSDSLTMLLDQMGQRLFEPPNVGGWPGGPAWLSSAALFARFNVAAEVTFPGGRPAAIPVLEAMGDAEAMVDEALLRLVDGDVPRESRDELVTHASAISDVRERAATVAYLVLCSPQFQLA
ncbi:MAG: hypothetical protein KatS3mg062_1384 [Tepidiforma sp.]|nr:MAG: hypothetical protein KatS3mg062_1384 [Tepidiforma sp.]